MNNLDNLKYAPTQDVDLKQTLEEVLDGSPTYEEETRDVKTEVKMEVPKATGDGALSDGGDSSDVDFDNMFADEEPQGVRCIDNNMEPSGSRLARVDSVSGNTEAARSPVGRRIGKLKISLKRKRAPDEIPISPENGSRGVPVLISANDGIGNVTMEVGDETVAPGKSDGDKTMLVGGPGESRGSDGIDSSVVLEYQDNGRREANATARTEPVDSSAEVSDCGIFGGQ